MKSALNQQSKRYCSQWFCYTKNSCKPRSPPFHPHTIVLYNITYGPGQAGAAASVPHTSRGGRLQQLHIRMKSPTQSRVTARSTELQ